LKGIDIFKRLGNSPGLALCLSNVGEVYLVQSEYEKAFESWEKCWTCTQTSTMRMGLPKRIAI